MRLGFALPQVGLAAGPDALIAAARRAEDQRRVRPQPCVSWLSTCSINATVRAMAPWLARST